MKRKRCAPATNTNTNTSNPTVTNTATPSDTRTTDSTTANANTSNPIATFAVNPNDATTSNPVTTIASNPNDTNTSNPVATNTNANTNTLSPTINVNPVININPASTGQQGLLTEFNFVPLDFNSVEVPVASAVLNSSPLILNIDNTTDRVWLTFSVQWRSIAGGTEVMFHIRRRRQGEADFTDICSTNDGVVGLPATTTLTCVDDEPILTAGQQPVEYQVTVEDAAANPVLQFSGIGTFTGAEIEASC